MHYKTVQDFIRHLQDERRLSTYTVRNYKKAIQDLCDYLKINHEDELFTIHINQARSFVIELQKKYIRKTIHCSVSGLRMYYRYLIKHRYIDSSPFTQIKLPKLEKKLPKFLTESQILNLLKGPQVLFQDAKLSEFEYMRDQAVLEILYGTGLRVSEAANLKYYQLNSEHCALYTVGKGNKERLCPMGQIAWDAVMNLKKHFNSSSNDFVLVKNNNKPLMVRGIQLLLKRYLKLAGLPMDITPHKIRHTYATHLLNKGIDLRILQKLLGHNSLSATQVYTHLDSSHLKKVHLMAHPRA